MADVKAVEIKINSDVLAALEQAKIVIQNYQADIRAAKEEFNVDLVGMGFCQGHVYTNAIHSINKIAYGEHSKIDMISSNTIDRSDAADARRMRWLMQGNGYYMEENMLCGHGPCSIEEQDDCRAQIDSAMSV